MDTIQAIQVPTILHAPLRAIAQPLIGETCTTELLGPVIRWGPTCVARAASKGIGLGIVAAGAGVKVPQILKLYSAKSAEGLSYAGYALESAASATFAAYSVALEFPFSTYGESVFIVAQNAIIMAMICYYRQQPALAGLTLLAFALAAFGLFALVPAGILKTVQSVALVVGLVAKIPPIVAVAKAGNTGALSAVTVSAYFAGSCARIFTTLAEVNDPLVLTSFLLNGSLNLVLLAQVLYYWNVPMPGSKLDEKKKQ
ncbi:hypothetical protein GGF32_009607 [Allomyces javanicus]|nr:hypothetical protein GGF32_009607 [Allomyces javanicus]